MPKPNCYLVLASKPWNAPVFEDLRSTLPGEWQLLDEPEQLTLAYVRQFDPRYLFFLHWSWKVPAEIVNSYECVCSHMTDVPYGRGGSPLQNLIVRGHRDTKLTALRMTSEFDAGPVYLKQPLPLEENAEEIYIRAARLSGQMIHEIVIRQPNPSPQSGEPVFFTRRKPEESEIPHCLTLDQLHDHIRMLDAEGYPSAFLVNGGVRYECSRAVLYDGRIVADVTIACPDNQETK